MSAWEPRRLSGRCSSGAERGAGTRVHAVVGGAWGRALCGARPGRLSAVGFAEAPGAAVTCARCQSKTGAAVLELEGEARRRDAARQAPVPDPDPA